MTFAVEFRRDHVGVDSRFTVENVTRAEPVDVGDDYGVRVTYADGETETFAVVSIRSVREE